MSDEMKASWFTGMKIKLTVQGENVIDGRLLCNEHNLLKVEALRGHWVGPLLLHITGLVIS